MSTTNADRARSIRAYVKATTSNAEKAQAKLAETFTNESPLAALSALAWATDEAASLGEYEFASRLDLDLDDDALIAAAVLLREDLTENIMRDFFGGRSSSEFQNAAQSASKRGARTVANYLGAVLHS